MKLYRITFRHDKTKYIVAKSYSQAEQIWCSKEGCADIDKMELISDSVIVAKN